MDGHKELLWPVNGASPLRGLMGTEPLAQCLPPYERSVYLFLVPELCAPFLSARLDYVP